MTVLAAALVAGACHKDAPPDTARIQDALPGMPLPGDPVFVSRSGSPDALQVVLTSAQSPEAIIQFYRIVLTRDPWTLVSDQPFDSGGRVFYASRNGPPLWVTIKPNPGGIGSLISLNGAVAPAKRDSSGAKPAGKDSSTAKPAAPAAAKPKLKAKPGT